MKITKSLVGAFIITFFIGHAAVSPTRKIAKPVKAPEMFEKQTQLPQTVPTTDIKEVSLLETIEEIDNWADEEKYPFKVKLLETGDGFHGQEVQAKNGETWMGVFEEKGEFDLRSVELRIKRVPDPIHDNKNTGKSVRTSNKKEALFLLKNADFLREGKIRTLFDGATWPEYLNDPQKSEPDSDEVPAQLKKDFVQNYEIGGKKYALKVIEAKNKAKEKILALILESDGKRQILQTLNVNYNPDIGTLYWAGDLDRDQMPDFYLELFEHENVENKVLFLSSKAEKEEFVRKVAYFWTTGC